MLLAGLLGLVTLLQTPLRAETPVADVVRVEEDWELVLAERIATGPSPQITCTFSPVAQSDALCAKLTLNHRTLPEAGAGGLQLQVWGDRQPLAYRTAFSDRLLREPGETIRWTQTTTVDAGLLTFKVAGRSEAWGDFASDGTLSVMVGTAIENLNGYDPEHSVINSGAGEASDRVASLVLKRVRLYSTTGLISEFSTPRVVHSLD